MGLKLSTLYKLALLGLLAAVVGLLLNRSVQAAVGLVYFTGEEDEGDVILEWETAYEDGTAGFRIRRSDNPNTDLSVFYDNAKTTFIPTESDESGFGGTYIAIDDTAQAGQSYVYTLYEVTTGNQVNELETTDQITINQGGNNNLATSTSAPTATSQSGTAATPTPTTASSQGAATPTTAAGVNPTATIASQATATQNIQPTATMTPTVFGEQPVDNGETSPIDNPEGGVDEEFEQPPAVPLEEEPVAVAEVSAQEEPYPAPAGEETDTGAPDSNVPQEAATETAYIEPNTNSQQGAQTIGSGTQTQEQTVAESTAEETSSGGSNTLLLWLGFLGALLIFGGGVVGSLLIFTRRREL